MRGAQAVAACFFGEGAAAEGAFHETMTLAALGRPRILAPATVDDARGMRLTVAATLAADHRVSDGRRGARCLGEGARLLEDPAFP